MADNPSGAGRPSKAELDRRQAELDERERALNDRSTALDATAEALVERRDELDEREQALKDAPELDDAARELIRTNAEAGAPGGYALLPEVSEGSGFIVLEAPSELVSILAALHPSELATTSAQMVGSVRQALVETGRYSRARRVQPPHAEVAVVASVRQRAAELDTSGA